MVDPLTRRSRLAVQIIIFDEVQLWQDILLLQTEGEGEVVKRLTLQLFIDWGWLVDNVAETRLS